MFHRCLALIAIGLLYSAPGTAQETPARGRTISPFNGRDFTAGTAIRASGPSKTV